MEILYQNNTVTKTEFILKQTISEFITISKFITVLKW